jgi:transcriptional regulator with XRE-family HTH domain
VTIKRLRKQRGLTQAELAKRSKLHRIYVAQIEAQTKTPSIAALERIAKVLRVTVGDLLE